VPTLSVFRKPGERVILFRMRQFHLVTVFRKWTDLRSCRAVRTLQHDARISGELRSGRVFRAYNVSYDMIDAEVANGSRTGSDC